MADSYEHLPLVRETRTTERRRPTRGGMGPSRPTDVEQHARNVRQSFDTARKEQDEGSESLYGFDDRYLFKFKTQDRVDTSALSSFGNNVELISEEDGEVFLAFVDEDAFETFQSRLQELEEGGQPTRRRVLWALQEAANWTAEDRMGSALCAEGFPSHEAFVLDVELWPLLRDREIRAGFEEWCDEQQLSRIDDFNSANLVLYRVRVTREQAEQLLRHRDVRGVDLPPRYGVDRDFLDFDISEYPELESPPDFAHKVAVLDSGIAANHPLLGSAIGDAQTFVEHEDASDSTGHGTAVAGIALWGDVAEAVEGQATTPRLWVLSGKVLYADDYDDPEYDRELIENQVTRAVEYFTDEYDCRVFNLSFGDRLHPYTGGHLGRLAVTLDELARRHEVVFVISSGNFTGTEDIPQNWREDYPGYLFSEAARLLDPAPALNGLTVGSYAYHEATFREQQRSVGRQLMAGVPIAQNHQPSPFTRRGPSVKGAVKPELIEHGGNWAVNLMGRTDDRGLGRVTTGRDFLTRSVLCEKAGTSFSAPHISHLAGRLFSEVPGMSANLARALLIGHAQPLPGIGDLLHESDGTQGENRDRVTQICGYGSVNEETLYRSTENEVVLTAESEIRDDQNHFYRIPIPDEYWSDGNRRREITVALSHMPAVRASRKDYKATRLDFRLLRAESYEEVEDACNQERLDEVSTISELTNSRSHPSTVRNRGTVQCSTWVFKRPTANCRDNDLFIVVRRNDHLWATGLVDELEDYALVLTIRDREREDARLYSRIQATLRARARGRS